MSTITTIHTLVPNASIPLGYFDEDNIRFIQNKIKSVLSREFVQDILIDRASIIRIMERVLEERIEAVPRMNERVIMTITNEFRVHQNDAQKHMNWEANYVLSQRMYDPSGEIIRFDGQNVKLRNRLGQNRVGSTTRFYFT